MSAVEPNSTTDIYVSSYIFDINFSSCNSHVATSHANGSINIFDYTIPYNTLDCLPLYSYNNLHNQSVRSIDYSNDGKYIYSVSSDRSMKRLDIEHNMIVDTVNNVHNTSINIVQCINENMVVSGDDDGYVNIYDIRAKYKSKDKRWTDGQPNISMQFNDAGDYISDLIFLQHKSYSLICASGDGYVYVYDLRGKGKSLAISDNMDTELLCITSCHNDSRILVGDRDHKLHIFTTDLYRWPSDHIIGHVQSIDSIITIDDNTVATGSSDGLIRLVQVQPNKMIGIIGQHNTVETLSKQYNQKLSSVDKVKSLDEMLHSSSDDDSEQHNNSIDNKAPEELHTSDFDSTSDDERTIDTTAILLGSDMPIERLRITEYNHRHYMVSTSHDNMIKLWNVDYLYEPDSDDGDENDVDESIDVDDTPIDHNTINNTQHLARIINQATDSDSEIDENDAGIVHSDIDDEENTELAESVGQPIDVSLFLSVNTASTSTPTKSDQQLNIRQNIKPHGLVEPVKTHKLTERDRKNQLLTKLRHKLAQKQSDALNYTNSDSSDGDDSLSNNSITASSNATVNDSSSKKRRRGKQIDDTTARHNSSFYADL